MNPDPLEARLARQPLRRVPDAWRREILASASSTIPDGKIQGRDAQSDSRDGCPSWVEALLLRLPLGWTGAAATALLLWLGVSSDRWLNGGAMLAQAPLVSREQVAEARAQRTELLQLAGLNDISPVVADRTPGKPPAALPRPRSDRRREEGDGFGFSSSQSAQAAIA